ncbi:YncE family protein [Paracoccus tibetensis]|uniref:DNA-binding beta-propeller fold protein YncE n=1 Tax=Paracoccus tibetensis TaxID=336292 RepID=A0A1G5EI00_9RHOB|nr:YncE family protein [Paracoccus tibetensis]SCY26582.1 DNA-binding beta-propeller fold protein YncE [Paracoccus tibetensis]
MVAWSKLFRGASAGLLLLAAPALAQDLAAVTSQTADRLSLVDLSTLEVIAEADIPGAPAPVAYDPGHGRIFVIAADTGHLHVLGEDLAPLAERALGEGAFGLAATGDGGVFVTDWFGGRLLRLAPDLSEVWQAETGAAPAGVAVDAAAGLVATADRDSDAVSIFDMAGGRLLHRVATAGAHPFGITFAAGALWTADVQGNRVSRIDPALGTLTGSLPTGSHPYAVAFAGGKGFVTNQYGGSVTIFDAASLDLLGEVDLGGYPEGIAALPDDSGVAVANWDSDTLTIIDAVTLEPRAELAMPAGPRAFGQFTGRRQSR